MLQLAGLAPSRLPDGIEPVRRFIRGRACEGGGFRGRGLAADLYYTLFAVEALAALKAQLPHAALRDYLYAFGEGEGLDLVHLACLARCWADVDGAAPPAVAAGILRRLQSLPRGGAYGCFLALAAHQDLSSEIPDGDDLVRRLESLRTPEGGYADDDALPVATVPSTAAALTVLRHLGRPADAEATRWLLARRLPSGGFAAAAGLPRADLLSTATALFALATAAVDLAPMAAGCLQFILALRDSDAGPPCGAMGFRGEADDETPDCEYTYYALLALGALSR